MAIAPLTPPAAGPDNLLGVCAALAELSGVPALIFRVGFVLAMLGLSFEITIAAYLLLGAAVAASRLGSGEAAGNHR